MLPQIQLTPVIQILMYLYLCSENKKPWCYMKLRPIFAASPLCNWDKSSKRTHWELQTWRSTQCAWLWVGGAVADPLIKTSFNLKKGLWRVTTGVSMLSSWPLPLEGGCYGIRASAVQSAPKTHLTHSLPWWWPDLKTRLHCFSTWLCACFP